nr:MAG TPA: hypothetical protein [Caudoviricetes sp.]
MTARCRQLHHSAVNRRYQPSNRRLFRRFPVRVRVGAPLE